MRYAISIFFALIIATTASATEFWACDGFRSTNDGSGGNPFLLKGTKSRYEYKEFNRVQQIKFIADNDVNKYRIYVDDTSNTHKQAYYLKFSGNQLIITKFTIEGYNFITTCYRQ